jgi:hypothetical protein
MDGPHAMFAIRLILKRREGMPGVARHLLSGHTYPGDKPLRSDRLGWGRPEFLKRATACLTQL